MRQRIGERVFLTDTTQCSVFRAQIDTLLNLLGHPEALVTDNSDLGDFLGEDPDGTDKIAELNDMFVCRANRRTKLWEVAKAMEAIEATFSPNESED